MNIAPMHMYVLKLVKVHIKRKLKSKQKSQKNSLKLSVN